MAVRDVVQAAAGVGGAGGEPGEYIEDVFSTYLYTGNGTSQRIENGIALGSSYGSGSVKLFNQGTQYSYEILGDDPALNVYSGPFTIECWFYLTANPTGDGAIFAAGLGATYTPIGLTFYSAINTLALNVSKDGSNWDVLGQTNLSSKVPLNQWHHCSVIYNGSAVGAYLNGTQFAYYATNTLLSSNYMNIGSYNGAIDGFVSDFRISNIARDGVSSGGSHSQSTWVNSATVADANTVFLSCRKDSPFTDSSSNNISLTVKPTVSASTFGPFDSDVAGQGGLVWTKDRGSYSHRLCDTERGATYYIGSDLTSAQFQTTDGLNSFNSDGFSIGGSSAVNTSAQNYVSWTFRKAPKFFDVVTWTGNGVAGRAIPHSLGSTPGFIQTKRTNGTDSWWNHHRSVTSPNANWWSNYGALDSTNAFSNWGDNSALFQAPDENNFYVGSYYNSSSVTYVAYLFAHDAGGFGDDGEQSIIKCGSFTHSGTTVVNLGWEAQWIMVKRPDTTDSWWMADNMRGLTVSGINSEWAAANLTSTGASNWIAPHPNGFEFTYQSGPYIYIAIRRPMKTPESGTEVLGVIARAGTGAAATVTGVGFSPDLVIGKGRNSGAQTSSAFTDKLRGIRNELYSAATAAEVTEGTSIGAVNAFTMDGFNLDADTSGGYYNWSAGTYINWCLRRAPSFMDVVAYTGNSSANRAISHSLASTPEFIIVKGRSNATSWIVYHIGLTGSSLGDYRGGLRLQSSASQELNQTYWANFPDENNFYVDLEGGESNSNRSGYTYIAYLFASLPGVSKVGSYTGTGADLNVDCGFSAGARFVLIKRTDSTGDWYVWDSARGIVSGNDPYLLLNSSAAENTSTDYIDPLASGFTVTSSAPAALNASGGNYIFLAIA